LVRIFLAALAITLTITLYVAFVIARPLNEMARAAEKMRDLKLRVQLIPDWRDRGDEIGVLSGVLRDTTEALRTRLDSIEGFAADVTHELKNPLTSLRSALETLPRIEDPNKRHQLLIIMREDTERLDRLITDIAKASRLDSELSREALYAVSLPEVFIHILRGFSIKPDMVGLPLPEQLITRYQDIRIVISGIDKMPPVAGNALRLQQIFDNILANAISFSPQGGVVMIRASLIDQYIRLEIEDQGPGIPKGKTETIFDRFYSERPSGEAFGMHSGLGLSIVRQIVMALNGRVWAENITTSDGRVQGACFIVEIPIFQDLT
jgi:two-component system sensor histidine kinase ChvG